VHAENLSVYGADKAWAEHHRRHASLHGSDRTPQRRPFEQFDEDDNFVAVTVMDECCATLAATWP
jgi:hypothetical protein